MKLQKITSPLWIGSIGPKINEYTKYLKEQQITYENLYSYLALSIQTGRRNDGKPDTSEFWVVFSDDGKPKAFAHWYLRSLPHIGKVFCDTIYSWAKTPRVVSLLVEEFLEFGKRHRSPVYEAESINQKVFEIFQKYMNEKGYSFDDTGGIHSIGRKKEN